MSVVKIIIMRSINLRMHDYFTQCSTLHNRDVSMLISMCMNKLCVSLFLSVFLLSLIQPLGIAYLKKPKKTNDWNPLFALLIHAMLSSVAAGETRGWGLLSLLLTV